MNEVWAVDEVWGVDRVWPTGSSNVSLEDFLLQKRGPQHLPLRVVVPITIVYAVIFLTGVVGNLAVCLVIVTNTSLHTATNYYLFSLAVSDLTLLLLGLPNDLSAFWQQYPWQLGEPLCRLRALISEMTSYTSVLTIVAFSMERYLAICHPLLSYTMSGLKRAVRIIAVLWILSFFSALPFAIYTKVNYITYPPGSDNIVEESAFCGMLEENIPKNFPIWELSFAVFFFIPLCVILLLYTKIGLQIRSKSLGSCIDGTVHKETKKFQSRKSIIRMLVAVVVTFFLCWAPYHVQRLHYVYGRGTDYYYDVNEWLYYFAGCFYYLSSTINPVLYNIMSGKYREGFRRTFCHRRSRHYSTTSSRETSGEGFRRGSIRNKFNDPDSGGGLNKFSVINNQPSVKSNDQQETRDLVVRITPDKDGAIVSTQTYHWLRTRLRVTMDHTDGQQGTGAGQGTICVEMETCL